jgi:hypothetical protein
MTCAALIQALRQEHILRQHESTTMNPNHEVIADFLDGEALYKRRAASIVSRKLSAARSSGRV